ncbi:SufD family Fe-S cluster assembly protein [Sphingomonas sp. MAH-20]|uniref:SufD family Fe-S cluster assembly protein n=1 Tax=Sphingomonas horti TaxID=2682842 RepID=A0A6I4J8K1_9SPHN|nr:SufD family Fe-S cluster assembly protein [Sphingomonas sp. CGMCC 1.13658]MBA2919099.1 SufD family Fe-S cluster assembly protein [Sphingomonas sp. CGMCC 1.13658]MVO79131.1 SufD family Fe-S cluster assembly protein [Sphingomonas horti]
MTALSLPSSREEAWRWADLTVLPALADQGPSGAGVEVPAALGDGPRLVFVDGRLDAARSKVGPLEVGAVDVRSEHPLGRLATGAGWALRLGRDHSAPGLVEIVHVGTGGASHVPGLIALEDDAQAAIVETFVGDGWANRLTAIRLGRSARLMRAVRLAQTSGFQSLRDEAEIATGASLVTTVLAEGGAGSRIDGHLRLTGDAAFAEMGGALLTRGEQRHEAAVVLRHEAEGCMSRQTWRAVADDTAVASLAARVEVARVAQKTDAEQSLRGLLLRRAATVNLKPELEIFADDVKCAHGATVGELDARALFYLASRGVPPAEARALLTRAFVADALERIGVDEVREGFAAEADAWLSSPSPQRGEGGAQAEGLGG